MRTVCTLVTCVPRLFDGDDDYTVYAVMVVGGAWKRSFTPRCTCDTPPSRINTQKHVYKPFTRQSRKRTT